jgi:hypothetical protein
MGWDIPRKPSKWRRAEGRWQDGAQSRSQPVVVGEVPARNDGAHRAISRGLEHLRIHCGGVRNHVCRQHGAAEWGRSSRQWGTHDVGVSWCGRWSVSHAADRHPIEPPSIGRITRWGDAGFDPGRHGRRLPDDPFCGVLTDTPHLFPWKKTCNPQSERHTTFPVSHSDL